MSRSSATEAPDWWANLSHGGLLIAPSRVAQHFPAPAAPLPWYVEDRLRRGLDRLEASRKAVSSDILDLTLTDALGLAVRDRFETGLWERGNQLGAEFAHRDPTGAQIKPRRLWRGPHGAELPVFVDDVERIGVHRGRRSHARVVEWLRAKGKPLALLTNGRQWRIIHAGLDSDSWAESDSTRWFEEGGEGPALLALRTLICPASLVPAEEGARPPLLEAIDATRRGQSELSSSLGENVRMAVERLITTHGDALATLLSDPPPAGKAPVRSQDVYIAACRIVMRLVVVLFAEAREGLLPMDRAAYRDGYSLAGLRESLERAAGSSARNQLRERRSAWPRLLALFRLVHQGSHHPELPIPRYGGGLFAPGTADAAEPVARATHVFETTSLRGEASAAMRDLDVFDILRLLTRSRIKIRAGKGSTYVVAPVDFSDLSTEYIGILYEGLLDYELRRVDGDAPVIFLNVGDQPALAIDRLEAMEDKAIKGLVDTLGKAKKDESKDAEAAEEPDEDEATQEDEEEPTEEEVPEESGGALEPDDVRGQALARVREWAISAVDGAGLVPASRSRSADALARRREKVEARAKQLIARTVLPGEWYLVRFGGTRKGSGTYYTKPQLAIPTVQRTLRPLCYQQPQKHTVESKSTGASDQPEWAPRSPEEILALKVCDPACGSGSFLVAALRYVTDALYRSLHHHGRISANGSQAVVRLTDGKGALRLEDELLPCPLDSDEFEPRLRARLRRHVVERCIHGVDFDPLAIELCRLALWVETLDRALPFTFLDHKIKCGNALVGCWFDRFRDYPVLAWERRGGDENHNNGICFEKSIRYSAIRDRKQAIRESLLDWIRSQTGLFDDADGPSPEERHQELTRLLEELHSLPVHELEARGRLFQESIQPALAKVRRDFDRWCSVWFWPADATEISPTPSDWTAGGEEAEEIVDRLARTHRFFHWELEFPDAFIGPESGFDAIVGNPPWEIQKPNSKEYFSNIDPLYRTYGKQEALRQQSAMFTSSQDVEHDWLDYSAGFKAMSNWVKHNGEPFGDPETSSTTFSAGRSKRGGTEDVHRAWRSRRAARAALSDPKHPFRHQGSADINTYKLFLEQSHKLLASGSARGGGRLGMIVPSGLYTDQGTGGLRALFLDDCSWEWLFSFENRRKIFDIHRSFKFAPIIVEKGARTEVIRTAFMRHELDDWAAAESVASEIHAGQIRRFSPWSRAFLETTSTRDVELLERIFERSRLIGSREEGESLVTYTREFDMVNDSKRFSPREKWEAKGYEPDEYSRWLDAEWHERTPDSGAPADAGRHELEAGVLLSRDGQRWTSVEQIRDMALPLYEGRMVELFSPSAKSWVSGKGRSAVWSDVDPAHASIGPQFLMGARTYESERAGRPSLKIGFCDITSATNKRTFVTSLLPDCPAGNVVGTLAVPSDAGAVDLMGVLGSLAFDWVARRKVGGTHLNWFVVEELPAFSLRSKAALDLVLRLAGVIPHLNDVVMRQFITRLEGKRAWGSLVARTTAERLRLRCMLDAVAFASAGLSSPDVRHALDGCDQSLESVGRGADPRGFWRVDKGRHPEQRHTVLTQIAFAALQSEIESAGGDASAGITAFLDSNEGEGWMLPDELRLADYDLGHDARARSLQPVASELGPRFLPSQVDADPRASWKECELHARNLAMKPPFLRS